MRLATIRLREGTRAVRLDEDRAVDLGASDLVAVLRRPGWRDAAKPPRYLSDGATLVTRIAGIGEGRNHFRSES